MEALLVIAAFGALAWFWYDSIRAREQAVVTGKLACDRDRLLFLDDTVQCVSCRPGRDADGQLLLRRVYRFEFSDTGNNRRGGTVVMLGAGVESVQMEPFYLQ
ncbi:MAG: DUF3301 domain-containing protein [Betaproteobacteria bacterium]|nr:DUF3301 domain-containing protein [Betaproteobacteria bacterium]